MTHVPTPHAMGRRRNVKQAPTPTPEPTPQWPSSATVETASGRVVQRDERPAPITLEDQLKQNSRCYRAV
jgi:hypothetical protein